MPLGIGIAMNPSMGGGGDPLYAGWTLITAQPDDPHLWSIGSVTVEDGYAGPDGSLTATRMLETAVNNNEKHVLKDPTPTNLVSGKRYMVESICKSIGGRRLLHRVFVDGYAGGAYRWFDLITPAVNQVSAYGDDLTSDGATIAAAGNGFYRCRNFFIASNNSVLNELFINAQNADGSDVAYLGEVDKGLYIAKAGLYIAS